MPRRNRPSSNAVADTYRTSWSRPSATTMGDRPPARIMPARTSAAAMVCGEVGIRPRPASAASVCETSTSWKSRMIWRS